MGISLSVRQLDSRLPAWLRNIVLRLYSSCSAETPRAVVLLSLSVVHMHLTLLRIFVGAARVAVGYVLLQMLDEEGLGGGEESQSDGSLDECGQ